MATSTVNPKGSKTTEALVRGINGKLLPGLCISELTWTEGERSETEDVCEGKTQGKTAYGVYQEITGTATVRVSFKDSIFVKRDFISFTDPDVNRHYLKLMAGTDCAGTAKATDLFEVITTSSTKANEQTQTFSFTLRRQPDFQP